VQRTI